MNITKEIQRKANKLFKEHNYKKLFVTSDGYFFTSEDRAADYVKQEKNKYCEVILANEDLEKTPLEIAKLEAKNVVSIAEAKAKKIVSTAEAKAKNLVEKAKPEDKVAKQAEAEKLIADANVKATELIENAKIEAELIIAEVSETNL